MADYYKIPKKLAERLALIRFRTGNADYGYVVNAGDLEPMGLKEAVRRGAEKITEKEALRIVRIINSKI